MGFITIFHHHLGEFVLELFLIIEESQIQGTAERLKVALFRDGWLKKTWVKDLSLGFQTPGEVFGPQKHTDQTPNLRRYYDWKTRV